jgi:xylulokinase
MSLLGIDVGTSGCKAAVFTEDGRLVDLAYEEYDYLRPAPGWAELDTPQLWHKVKRAIRKASAASARDPIQALCVSSLGEAVVPVTANRKILGPSLLNFDSRGAEYLPEIKNSIPVEKVYRINGNPFGGQYSLTKLMWIKQHQPDLYRQTDFFLHWSGFVSFMLGAEARVDYSLANRTLLFDLEGRDWSDDLLAQTHLNREKLPATVASGTVIGNVERDIASELGLPPGIPIVSGGHDQCCNGVGCGVIAPGQAMYGMGTYLCMMPVFIQRPNEFVMMKHGLNTENHVVPGLYVSFIYNQGGALVKWYRDTFARLDRQNAEANNQDIYTRLLAEMPENPSRLMVLPHFTATGPPDFIDDSYGVIAGLKLETPRAEILKGLIEATTFYLRECFEALPETGIDIKDFRAVGGASKSDAWVQICADILGRPFLRPRINEAGVLGAAILAGTGSLIFRSLEEGVKAMVQLDRTFFPDLLKQNQYNDRFIQYKKLWPLMADYLRALAT